MAWPQGGMPSDFPGPDRQHPLQEKNTFTSPPFFQARQFDPIRDAVTMPPDVCESEMNINRNMNMQGWHHVNDFRFQQPATYPTHQFMNDPRYSTPSTAGTTMPFESPSFFQQQQELPEGAPEQPGRRATASGTYQNMPTPMPVYRPFTLAPNNRYLSPQQPRPIPPYPYPHLQPQLQLQPEHQTQAEAEALPAMARTRRSDVAPMVPQSESVETAATRTDQQTTNADSNSHPAEPDLSSKDTAAMIVPELRKELGRLGLKKSGVRAELEARLDAARRQLDTLQHDAPSADSVDHSPDVSATDTTSAGPQSTEIPPTETSSTEISSTVTTATETSATETPATKAPPRKRNQNTARACTRCLLGNRSCVHDFTGAACQMCIEKGKECTYSKAVQKQFQASAAASTSNLAKTSSITETAVLTPPASETIETPQSEPDAALDSVTVLVQGESTVSQQHETSTPVSDNAPAPDHNEVAPDHPTVPEAAQHALPSSARKPLTIKLRVPPHLQSPPRTTAPTPPTERDAVTPRTPTRPMAHPAMYGREPNSRRAATKAFGKPATPKKKQSRAAAVAAALATIPVTPQTQALPNKRPAPGGQIGSKEKRQKQGDDSSEKVIPRRHTVHSPVTSTTGQQPTPPQTPSEAIPDRPERDEEGDTKFVEDLRKVLEVRKNANVDNIGRRQAARILALLEKAEYPSQDEARFLSTDEASACLQPGRTDTSIIITSGQQTMPLQTIEDFLAEYYDDNTKVYIQDPNTGFTKNATGCRPVKMSEIKQRILFGDETNEDPWNLLELATHCDDGLRPQFLNTEDTRLLTKLKIPNSADHARRRTYQEGYKEVEKWALLAQAGALTEPHQDSHGYGTYITINQGLVGFGWLSNPTPEERTEWCRIPSLFAGGRWRYIVLKPGQTVYFPAGTVHFVFRSPTASQHTLAFGGHVLRCSTIVHWVKTLIEERNSKDIVNEDLTHSATGYLARVEKFVKQARVNGTEHKWGGKESIAEFLKLKREFQRVKQK